MFTARSERIEELASRKITYGTKGIVCMQNKEFQAAANTTKEASQQVVLQVLLAKITMHTNQLSGSSYFYEGHLESKEHFAIQRYLLINRKEKYAGFMTHLHLLLHIVTLDIEALVVT